MLSKTLAIVLFCSTISYSQFILDECPDQITCVDELFNTQVTIPVPTGSTSDVESCDGVNFSQMSMVFAAPAELVTIQASWSTDDQLTMGIVTDCSEENICIESVSCNASGLMSMTVEVSPGRTYILYIDACDNTVSVDVNVSIEPDGLTELFDEAVELGIENFCEDTEYVACSDYTFKVDFFMNDFEYWNARNAQWTISYDGPTWGQVTSDDLDNFLMFIVEPGVYEICFQSVLTECWTYYPGYNACTWIEILGTTDDPAVYDVCEHDLNAGWIPYENWDGPVITEPGEYEVTSEDVCDCIVNKIITVNKISEKETEIEVELCPQDYPYDFMGEEEYDYSQLNIEDVIFLDEGSVVEDYNGNACDSVIYLILVNEGPQDRCSSCNLPVSLEKGKIVFCLPFDNATVDVSGQNTIVRPTGIAYDDNGSKENDFWEAILDGDEDYIKIPHIDNLNTSVFSLNFQFNKDDSFENGDLETIISKGDSGQNNLRYDVSLQKVNESIFDLKGTFYTANGQVNVDLPDLQIFNWYDIAYVVESDTISLYLDGYVYSKVPIFENLKGNTEDLYIGTLINNNARTQFYNGRLDNFKYWKQKLSGQDVFFLHFPEKEFEVEYSYFLSCCEQADFRDVLIDINNPLDSIIVPNASPTGYDSLYILNYIQADPRPELNNATAPQDMVVQYQQTCMEFCQATVNWASDLSNLFTDNCGNVAVSQSHGFDVVLDENISFVEVTLTGTDNCGQSTTHSFGLELECLPSNVVDVPEQNVFEVMANEMCINQEEEICIFSDIQLQLGYVDQGTNTMQSYESTSDFNAVININGVDSLLTPTEVTNGVALNSLGAGSHVICLVGVSSECETIANNYCQTITIRESIIVDYGEVVACRDDIESALPSELSQELRNLILGNPQETSISVTETDDCGCANTEKLSLVINERVEEDLTVELCDGDIFDGRTEDEIFTVELMTENGCDSLIHVDLKFLPKTEEVVFAEICEGDSFEGYTEEGTYIEEHSNFYGCDSSLTIHLSVLPKSYENIFVEICPDSTYLGFNETGVYEIVELNILGCDSTTTLDLTVLDEMHPDCFVSSLNELSDNKISVFPNPVGVYLTLKAEGDISSVLRYEIFDISGRLILSGKSLSNQIDVSRVESGIFLLKLIQSNHTDRVIKFVKI